MALVGAADDLQGIITDGDLRRLLVDGVDLASKPVGDVASKTPLTVGPDVMMVDAEEKMLEARVQCLVVVGDAGHVEGIIQIYE